MLITRDDIQRVGDEETLLCFLEKKLNLPIWEEATLAQIALPLPLPFLGLDESVVEQVIDCQDFKGLPEDAMDGQEPFLIRFRYESGYPEILREVAEGLYQKNINPAEIFFICAGENFRPFAFAYFNHTAAGNWQTASLNILAWTQENTHIHTSPEHELPTGFFPNESSEDFSAESDDSREASADKLPYMLDNKSASPTVKSISPETLLAKLEGTGTLLSRHVNIHAGIVAGKTELYVIDLLTRERLLNADPRGGELIKPIQGRHQKWQGESKSMIWIPSTKNKRWPWSDAKTETEAEKILAQTYPEISEYLNQRRDKLKSFPPAFKGEFWWEFPSAMSYSELQKPKILYPFGIKSMRASYDPTGKIIPKGLWFIPTDDLSLLAILNSTLFNWHAQARYKKFGKNWNFGIFGQQNMESITIADKIKVQRELLDWVDQILSDPTNTDVPAIEKEIDALVYDLYDLTSAEIALIEEETNQ